MIAVLRPFVERISRHPRLSDLARNTIEGGMITVRRELRRELDSASAESVVELGCGTGQLARVARGEYVGVDLDARHLVYAGRRRGGDRRRFVLADARATGLGKKQFDAALMVGVIHHLTDTDVGRVLAEAQRLARKRLLIVDLVPLRYNLLGRLLYHLDRGAHIRSLEHQLELVGRHLPVSHSRVFRSGMDLHSLIVCSLADGPEADSDVDG